MRGALRTTAVLLALLCCSWQASARAKLHPQYIGDVRGEIVVSADGRAKTVTITPSQVPALDALLAELIKQWEFHPVMVNGRPMEATVPINLTTLLNLDDEGKFSSIEFLSVTLGISDLERPHAMPEPRYVAQRQINYPRRALVSNLRAYVEVVVDIGPNGRVHQADVSRFALLDSASRPDENLLELGLKEFGNAAKSAIMQWQFSPEQLAANNCTGGCVSRIPVDYKMRQEDQVWRVYDPYPIVPPAWASQGKVQDITNTEQSQLVRLKQDPTGQPLETGG